MQFKTIYLVLTLALFLSSCDQNQTSLKGHLKTSQDGEVTDGADASSEDLKPTFRENFIYDSYIEIDRTPDRSLNITTDFKVNHEEVYYSLLDFNEITEKFPQPTEPYNRDEQFGTWIKPNPFSCFNTRGLVLIRDSEVEVTYNHNCTILTGRWYDNFTDSTYTSARDVQIDHFIPLKNAYSSGAFEWDRNKKCLYANYLGNNNHLITVYKTENLKKGDKHPGEYVPPNKKYVCEYLVNWLKNKFIWQLKLTPFEKKSIKKHIVDYQCKEDDFFIEKSYIESQIETIEANKNLCNLAA